LGVPTLILEVIGEKAAKRLHRRFAITAVEQKAGEKMNVRQISAITLAFVMCGPNNHSSMSDYSLAVCHLVSGQIPAKTIYVESWKTGGNNIQEQTITVELGPSQRSYEVVISSMSAPIKYLLTINYQLWGASDLSVECYKVILSEYTGAPRSGKRRPSYNLLVREQPSGGQDYFPKEDSVAAFFPLDDIPVLKYGFDGYPISAKRVIKVESFYCIIQAVSYKISAQKPGTFDSLTLQIKFGNKYEGPR
jgi:hypothetical protein